MFETIFDLIRDPSNFANWMAIIEVLIALAMVVGGLVAIAYAPALWPAGLLLILGGGAGLVFGHF